MTLLEKYETYHKGFEARLNSFSKLNAARFKKKLKQETRRDNFLSIVSEIRFGELFNSLGIDFEYDRKFSNNQTPDYTLTLSNSRAICDVYRLGKSRIDQIRSDFENDLMERIEKIPASYCLKITFLEEYFDEGFYDSELIFIELEKWLLSNPLSSTDKICILDNFGFEIIYNNTNVNHVTCIGNASNIDIKPNKLKQLENSKPNEITKKLTKYNDIISQENLPYFICVDIDFVSGFDHNDFIEHFRGFGVTFIDYGTAYGNMEQFRHLGMNWTDLGEFYKNPQLSGIITYFNQEFKLLLNPQIRQQIYNESNYELLTRLNKI